MRTASPWAAFAAALWLAASPAAAGKARSFRIQAAGRSVRVVVPELFEPLLPGSVYPNRRKPRKPRATPVAIVEAELAGDAEPFLLDRGFVVAEVETIDAPTVDRVLDSLAASIEGGIGEATLLARRPGDALSDRRIRAAALFDPAPPADLSPRGAGGVLFFGTTAGGSLPAASAPHGSMSERWYRSDHGFPREAFRDAAEWLAAPSSPSTRGATPQPPASR